MTSIRFIGDIPLWAGLLLALAAGLGAWWYYRRESRDLPGRLRWLLPLLRAAAIALTVMILTGPVLHHRQVVGTLARVRVFLDASQSMSVTDRCMPIARKLMIAQQQGWLPPSQIDQSLWEMVSRLSEARQEVARQLRGSAVEKTRLDHCRNAFAEAVNAVVERAERYPWAELTPDQASAAAWGELPQRVRTELVDPARKLLDKPIDDAAEREDVARQLLALGDAAAPIENLLMQALERYGAQLAASGNQATASALALVDATSRWKRAENALLGDSSDLLGQLARSHDVQLLALTDSESEVLWDSHSGTPPPTRLDVEPVGRVTDLGSGILGRMAVRLGGQDPESKTPAAVVLITDGRQNAGPSPLQTARLLGGQSIPVFAIGMGGRREPPDLALIDVRYPDTVFQKDRVRGSVVVKDRMPAGQSFAVQIASGDTILWQQTMKTQDVPRRQIDFEFSVDALVQQLNVQLDDTQVRHHALPLSLDVSILPLEGETDSSNNQLTMHLAAVTQNYKLLLIGGRPRWETRYIRNVFERDDQWEVDTFFVGPAAGQATLPRGDGPGMFPIDKAALFEYDLIILGELPSGVLTDHEQAWFRAFIETRGGGIIFIDGPRGDLRRLDPETLGMLIPAGWPGGDVASEATRLQLTDAGARQSSLMLQPTDSTNREFWQQLPPPHRITVADALPGTEVWLEAVVDGKSFPVLVTRRFGAGRVVFCAFDETWRWRYKVADTYHQRFWNQLARWAMPRPFTVSDQYVALDSGPPSYQSGERAEIRVRLQNVDGRPVSDATVDALLWKEGRIVSTVNLIPEGQDRGIYRGQTASLSEGRYEVSVRASGFSDRAMKARTRLVVLPPENRELRTIACNDPLLRAMASESSGRFLREERIDRLIELLKPLSDGHIIESDTLLWQSYWWFTAILGLLTLEWLLRKRAGLL